MVPSYAFLALAAEMIYCIRAPYLTIVQAVGRYKETKHGAYVEAGMNIIISVICTILWGLIGVVIGTICANVFRTVQYFMYISKNLVLRDKRIVLTRIMWMIGNISASVMLADWLIKGECDNWLAWIESAIEVLLLSLFIAVLSAIVFYKDDLEWLKIRFMCHKSGG